MPDPNDLPDGPTSTTATQDPNLAPEDGKSGIERRRSQRVLLNIEVDYCCEDTFLFAYITDLSALGIFIRTNTPEPPGTRLNLKFSLPTSEEPLELEGEVIWVNTFRPGDFSSLNPGMGVRFSELSRDQRRTIRRMIRTIAYLEESENGTCPRAVTLDHPDEDAES